MVGISSLIGKFSDRKESLELLRKRKHFFDIEPAVQDFPSDINIFINESLCPYYRGMSNKWKKLRGRHLVHQYYTISGTVRVKVEENGSPKCITHMVDLDRLFLEIGIESW